MHVEHVVAADVLAHLADGLEEGQRLDVADGAADLDHGDVGIGRAPQDGLLDLVGDMGDDLNRPPEVVYAAFLTDDALVDLTGSEIVAALHGGAHEALVMTEIEVCLGAVGAGDVDALVCPVTVTPPFAHLQDGNVTNRIVPIDGVERPYTDLFHWTILIGMAYLPATVVPVTTTTDGLPVGVQIVGPYLEDRTPLGVARALRDELGPIPLPERPVTPG